VSEGSSGEEQYGKYPGILFGSAFQHIVKIAAAATVMSSQPTVARARGFCCVADTQNTVNAVRAAAR
jgi:hypothetical protein